MTVYRNPNAAAFVLVLMALVLPGCEALSRSSMSSVSLASAMSSLQSSSAAMGAYAPYQEDVRALAMNAAEQGATAEELLGQVGRVAAEHGVSDWEAEPVTYFALGQGLSQGGLDAEHARTFGHDLAGENPQAFDALIEGYES